MSKKIEAEGNELVLRNEEGDVVIIPKDKREKALEYIKAEDNDSLDVLISELPRMEDYAEDGTLLTNDNLKSDLSWAMIASDVISGIEKKQPVEDEWDPSNETLGIDKKYKSGGSVHKIAKATHNIKKIVSLMYKEQGYE